MIRLLLQIYVLKINMPVSVLFHVLPAQKMVDLVQLIDKVSIMIAHQATFITLNLTNVKLARMETNV